VNSCFSDTSSLASLTFSSPAALSSLSTFQPPQDIPFDVTEFLKCVHFHLHQYADSFIAHGVVSLEDMMRLNDVQRMLCIVFPLLTDEFALSCCFVNELLCFSDFLVSVSLLITFPLNQFSPWACRLAVRACF
jgi:hypothetical protein